MCNWHIWKEFNNEENSPVKIQCALFLEQLFFNKSEANNYISNCWGEISDGKFYQIDLIIVKPMFDELYFISPLKTNFNNILY